MTKEQCARPSSFEHLDFIRHSSFMLRHFADKEHEHEQEAA